MKGQIAVGETITATGFLSIAMALFSLGVKFYQQGNMGGGIVCFLTAVSLVFLTIALVQLGFIRMQRRVESGKQSPQAH
jgi:uncharacterized membrane protein YidH (DUF202 family)